MKEKIRFGDGVADEIKNEVNNQAKDLADLAIESVFDYLKTKVKEFPEMIEQMRVNAKSKEAVKELLSQKLYDEGLVPKGYKGLPDELLISNLHQDGYLAGLYSGYVIAMMALVDKNVPSDIVLEVRDYIREYLIGHHFDDRDEIQKKYEVEKYTWIEKAHKE